MDLESDSLIEILKQAQTKVPVKPPADGTMTLSLGNRVLGYKSDAQTKWDIRVVLFHDAFDITDLKQVHQGVEPGKQVVVTLKVSNKPITDCFVSWTERYGLTKVYRCLSLPAVSIGSGLTETTLAVRWHGQYQDENDAVFEAALGAILYPST